ncbi:FAD-binding oxidoreductase, partial [Burkholderia cenocepacia]
EEHDGYSLNAFLDYDSPLDIFMHLLVASEGTLAFIAEAVLRTVEVPKLKTTTIAEYPTLDAATRSLPALFDSKAATLELMDSRSIKVGRTFDSVPEQITCSRRRHGEKPRLGTPAETRREKPHSVGPHAVQGIRRLTSQQWRELGS